MNAVKKNYKHIRKFFRKKVRLSHALMIGAAALVVCIVLAICSMKYGNVQGDTSSNAVIRSVARQFNAPQETPTVGTVADPEKLRDQVFFRNAERGDKILIYKTAGEVVLYRPSSDSIVASAPLVN